LAVKDEPNGTALEFWDSFWCMSKGARCNCRTNL